MMEVRVIWSLIKAFFSTVLLIFSITVIMALIFNRETKLAADSHPAVAYIVMWIAVIWLSMVEGGQASLVGLVPVNGILYENSHLITYKCTSITNKGDNIDRYLLGRQFMVVLIVFLINHCGASMDGDFQLWGFPHWLTNIFLNVGLAMILFTCMVGQLTSQVNASVCMLDYIDNYFALFTLWIAMAIEFSGLLHAAYLIQIVVAVLAGKEIQSNEGPRKGFQFIFFWLRVVLSVVILAVCFVVTFVALIEGKTTKWDSVPNVISIVLFFILMSIVGLLEGMQIAFSSVAKIHESERGNNKFAKWTCDILFQKRNGLNLPGFMIGRQLCVVSCFFFIARITTQNVPNGETNVMNVPNAVQEFFDTGFCSAIITTIIGSIAWQLVASAFPIAFLSNPFTYSLLRFCLFLEATGICSGVWALAALHKWIAEFWRDERYIGTAEQRAKWNLGDSNKAPPALAEKILSFHKEDDKLFKFKKRAPPNLKILAQADADVRNYLIYVAENYGKGFPALLDISEGASNSDSASHSDSASDSESASNSENEVMA